MQIIVQCSLCRHFRRENRDAETCAAFPAGIPTAILTNQIDHCRAVDGDGGIRFEPAEDLPTGLVPTRWLPVSEAER